MKETFKQTPSDEDIRKSRITFSKILKNGKVCHATTSANASKIEKNGLRAPAYLSFEEPSWRGEVIFSASGNSLDVEKIFPDPEHLLDGGYFDHLNLSMISFEEVIKHIDPRQLCWMYFDFAKSEGWPLDEIAHGFWLVSAVPIAKEKLVREK